MLKFQLIPAPLSWKVAPSSCACSVGGSAKLHLRGPFGALRQPQDDNLESALPIYRPSSKRDAKYKPAPSGTNLRRPRACSCVNGHSRTPQRGVPTRGYFTPTPIHHSPITIHKGDGCVAAAWPFRRTKVFARIRFPDFEFGVFSRNATIFLPRPECTGRSCRRRA
jgi:hypothetical protein